MIKTSTFCRCHRLNSPFSPFCAAARTRQTTQLFDGMLHAGLNIIIVLSR